ncbi:MAG: hypothetical protein WCC48_05765, partial [Anaeromyxobacteraceae bacterium]
RSTLPSPASFAAPMAAAISAGLTSKAWARSWSSASGSASPAWRTQTAWRCAGPSFSKPIASVKRRTNAGSSAWTSLVVQRVGTGAR